MYHANRKWSVAPVPDAETLAGKLTEYSWTLCTGFRLGDLVYLNDATSEDSVSEWGVVYAPPGIGVWYVVESVTFGWLNRANAEALIQKYARESKKPWSQQGWIRPRVLSRPGVILESQEKHVCDLCR